MDAVCIDMSKWSHKRLCRHVNELNRLIDKRERRIGMLETLIQGQWQNMDDFGRDCASDFGLMPAWQRLGYESQREYAIDRCSDEG